MKWAASKPHEPITQAMIVAHEVTIDGITRVNVQLGAPLIALVKGDLLNAPKNLKPTGSGLEAWKRFALIYDPVDAVSSMRLLQKLQGPAQCIDTEKLLAHIETWELLWKEYEDRSYIILLEEQIQLCLKIMVPDTLRQHLGLNAPNFNTYASMRGSVAEYLTTRISSNFWSADIGYLGGGKPKGKKGNGAEGKDKDKGGKGKNAADSALCRYCKSRILPGSLHT